MFFLPTQMKIKFHLHVFSPTYSNVPTPRLFATTRLLETSLLQMRIITPQKVDLKSCICKLKTLKNTVLYNA